MIVREAIAVGEELLRGSGVENCVNESRWLLCECLGVRVGRLNVMFDEDLSDIFHEKYMKMVSRRMKGEPLQYVIGNVDFWDLRLFVGPGVLIPRPETEELVELALNRLEVMTGNVCDVCTGSGAIALSLAHARKECKVFGTDISSVALGWAERNRRALDLSNVTLLECDLYSGLPVGIEFDMIVSNPPYVSESEYAGLERVVKDYEPRLALVAENDGLALLERVASEGLGRLRGGGWLLCEMGDEQGAAMLGILEKYGYVEREIRKDMGGHDRIAIGRKPG